jgi:hypothetical protein
LARDARKIHKLHNIPCNTAPKRPQYRDTGCIKGPSDRIVAGQVQPVQYTFLGHDQ